MATAKKLPSGNYRVIKYIGKDENGQRMYKSFTAPTKKEAELLALSYAPPKPADNSLSLSEAVQKYIDMKSNVLSPSTLRVYIGILKYNIAEIGYMDIMSLTSADLQKYINSISNEKSPKTVRNINGLISSALKAFRPDFKYTVTLPPKAKGKIYIPTLDDIKMIDAAIKGHRLELAYLMTSRCGLRPSEFCALTSESFDLKSEAVTVSDALVNGLDKPYLKGPKSFSGYRSIPCSKKLIEKALEACSENNNRITNFSPQNISRNWHKFLTALTGVEYFNFYALRHYFASQAFLSGIPKEYLVEIMGHASESMLNEVYLHTFPDVKEKFALKLKTRFANLYNET